MAQGRWWGDFEIAEGGRGRWRVGPLSLWVERRAHEWRVTERLAAEAGDDGAEASVPAPGDDEPPPEARVMRYVVRETTAQLSVLPRLADRSVVVRTATPLHLLAGEEARLYVSTPLWLELRSGGELGDFATLRLSDTWFGPNTMLGELCYASRTAAELDLENLQLRAWRAVTVVTLRNRASDPVLVDRINLPIQRLSLFVDDSQGFWTDGLVVTRDEDAIETSVTVAAGPPAEAPRAKKAAGPRRERDRHKVIRAFSALLG